MKICKHRTTAGNIHSIETFGTLEGPGIRLVVFTQGCLGRCLYCQNPDTWKEDGGRAMEAAEIMGKIDNCLPYIRSSGGGITVSGGEPLLQMDFILGLFALCKEKDIHTAIDTSAFYRETDEPELSALFDLTDLFIVDIKAMDAHLHERLTSRGREQVVRFINLLDDNKKEYWLRYVLVPDLNDSDEALKKLGAFARSLNYCRKLEFLPYHTLGKHKWGLLGMDYPLEGKRIAADNDIKRAKGLAMRGPV
ncbi:MAG: pyruvate formate-lyase-activating protein [Candidatus Omnitrophica bacterium]|nr:pyruvate formate-lyase-activating protein [Candidatus Omnitrophota bacterium]MDD5553703.1 pyruvate formate-lyase-activating protein [Candidatus Omnitrophota bacterium]